MCLSCCTLRIAGEIHLWASNLQAGLYVFWLGYRAETLNKYQTLIVSIELVICIELLFSVLAMRGINKDKHNFLLPWLILRAIIIVQSILVPYIFLGVAIFQGNPTLFAVALAALFCIGLWTWSWIVIYRLYKEIKRMRNEQSFSPVLPYVFRKPKWGT